MTEWNLSEWRNQARTAGWDDKTLALKAVDFAQQILRRSQGAMTQKEKRMGARMERLMDDACGKELTLALMDRFFRAEDPVRRAEQFRHLAQACGVPQYLPPLKRALFRAELLLSKRFPKMAAGGVERRLRAEGAAAVLSAEKSGLRRYARRRGKEGVRLNFNQPGGAVLGEDEAKRRLEGVLALLEDPAGDGVSVKLSSICSRIRMTAFEETLARAQECLRILFRAAQKCRSRAADGGESPKFINLDMDEYRDLHLTCEAFKRTLMEEEFLHLRAGIALQAYLPDAWEQQMALCAWAKERAEKGGASIRLRLVKGANLAMEQVEASLRGWPQAPYLTKAETDANYKRMLHCGLMPENARFVQLGVASHNLFDFSYALLLSERGGASEYVEFEMLEGMAGQQVRAIAEEGVPLLLYVPVASRRDFPHAVFYLVRRLDESTRLENFLHDSFGMTSSSPGWAAQKKRFLASCSRRAEVSRSPRRAQNRAAEKNEPAPADEDFANEPDTDWCLPANREWIAKIIADEGNRLLPTLPLVIGGREAESPLNGVGRDPSLPEHASYHFSYATFEDVDTALGCACAAAAGWGAKSLSERGDVIRRAGANLADHRGELIAAMLRDTAKTIPEADAEVSGAIDFCRYYSKGLNRPGMDDGVEFTPRGVICAASSWRSPCAIPCEGIASALMAGNAVLFKPSPQAVLVAWTLVQRFWEAGVPKEVLQFIPVLPNEIGRKLLSSPKIDAVVLAGSYAAARLFQEWNPNRPVFAGTGGKGSVIITAMADLDLAVRDLVTSAFGHSGQTCPAAGLAILEAPVYDDPAFLNRLKDAVSTLKAGSAWKPDTDVAPLTLEPGDALMRGLTQLDEGESWLLEPRRDETNPRLWSPGIRLGVKRGSWFHRNESSGPVLGLMRAENLGEAILMQNDGAFGLTAGIFSLDERETTQWKQAVQAGNLYINRPAAGAVVRRQPFGGWKKSSVGPGLKSGGPNYLTLFGHWKETALPHERAVESKSMEALRSRLCNLVPDAVSRISAAAGSMDRWWRDEFGVEHDPSACLGERNSFRYLPAETAVRVETGMSDADLAIILLAARRTGCRMLLSLAVEPSWFSSPSLLPDTVTVVKETRGQFAAHFPEWAGRDMLVRDIASDEETRRKAQSVNLRLIEAPVLANARLELLHYLREQTISETVHRYGVLYRHSSI